MQRMTMADACRVTGMSRKVLTGLMDSGEWDIGYAVNKPGARYRQYIIMSHKLAKVMGVPEQKITAELAKIDAERKASKL